MSIPNTVPNPDPDAFIDIDPDTIAAVLYLCPWTESRWPTFGPRTLAVYALDLIVRVHRHPELRFDEIVSRLSETDAHDEPGIDALRLLTARRYALDVFDAMAAL